MYPHPVFVPHVCVSVCVCVCVRVCSWVRRAGLLSPGHTSHPEPLTAPVPSSSPGVPAVSHGAGRCPLGCIAFVSHISEEVRGMSAGWGGPRGVTGANWCYLNASEPFWRRAQSRAGSGQWAGPLRDPHSSSTTRNGQKIPLCPSEPQDSPSWVPAEEAALILREV